MLVSPRISQDVYPGARSLLFWGERIEMNVYVCVCVIVYAE